MTDVDRWRDSYDDWKTIDPAEAEEPDEPCERCHGTGEIIACVDDMCRGLAESCHGDDVEVCPDCEGRG